MATTADLVRDVMQVCRNGHVITDLLKTCPANGQVYCDRCGADTLSRCPSCDSELPGAVIVPGLTPVGARQPPSFCPVCGEGFPWARLEVAPPSPVLAQVEALLRRLPRV